MKNFVSDEPEQSGSGIRRRDDTSIYSMLLTLANENLFDDSGCLRTIDGTIVPETSVGKLVAYACRPETLVKGTIEFANVLQQIGVNQVPNENLMALMGRAVGRASRVPRIRSVPLMPPEAPVLPAPLVPPPTSGENVPESQGTKRPLDDEVPGARKRLRARAPVTKRKRVGDSGPSKKVQKTATWQLRQQR